MLFLLLLAWGPCPSTASPRFDPTAVLRDVLVPADAAALSVIYRLRASDPSFAYPLVFKVRGSSSHVDVVSLNCTRFNSVCQANVVLKTRLEIGRIYDFIVEVGSQSNQTATMDCSFLATNATTPVHRIFPGAPSLLRVSEGARRNTELGALLARGNPLLPRAVLLELWGAPEFGLRQKLVSETDAEATVLLLSSLDYEKKNVHHLTILANNPWTDMATDTRNIASWPLVVVVIDEQDTPPVFSIAPPTTILGGSLRPGDIVLRVHAEDGDRGNPRAIKYALVPGEDSSDHYFDIDEDSGELRLAVPLADILSTSRSGQPILVHVVAEEVRSRSDEAPAQSTTIQLALIPPGSSGRSPTFGAIDYHALLDENAPTGTSLEVAQAEVNSQPGQLVLLELDNNNGTFDISPKTVTDGYSKFQITVHDPSLLDYEARQTVECYIVARELGSGNHTARAKLTVLLNNLNDNPPTFTQEEYRASVQEHATTGTNIMVVEAVDGDKDPKSKVRYTKLLGQGSQFFHLDPDTGLISVADSEGLDAETGPVITFKVEATDANGTGMSATTTVAITLLDINDNAPQFDKKVYEFILNKEKTGFTNAAVIRATDRDVSPPNNEIHYEIIDIPSYLHLDERTGELSIRKYWPSDEVTVLRARAWDGGVPRLSSECEIRIYPSEGQARKMVFIVPGRNPDRAEVAKTLGTLTGGRVAIDRIRTYTGDEPGAMYVSAYANDGERSVVEATVTFFRDSIIDLNEINKIINNGPAEGKSGANKKMQENNVKEIIRIREGHSGGLLWLLIFFFILLIIALLLLICCCLCRECPLYNYTIFKKIKDTPVVEKIHILGSGQGRESKSVQVAEWFGRKEAWTPDNVDAESIRRYELDRGSERGGAKQTLIRQSNVQQEPPRDQFYFREGNTDILRLITRGGEAQKPVSLNEQPYVASDSGKDILMKRFMDQQQTAVSGPRVFMPNSVNRLQAEQELLENSLRQQNALLRQILLERERDLRLETQSLPAGTQTDQDAGTQTEPIYLRPPARKVRSDNDQSDLTEAEDEIAAIKARTRRRQGKKTRLKRAIRTPIQEEAETEMTEKVEMQNKASESRKRKASSETKSTRSRSSGLRREVLEEISASLERSDSDGVEGFQKREAFSDDSLEATPRSERTSTDSARHKYHSESDLRTVASVRKPALLKQKNKSQVDLTNSQTDRKPKNTTSKHQGSRYMDWYKKKPTAKGETKDDKQAGKRSAKRRASATHNGVSRHIKDADASASKEVGAVDSSTGPEHPLLQHSEHRFEVRYPRKPEEDVDSGIALTKPPIAQKKSVFTIAYDGMHTKQLRTDSLNSP